MRPKIPCEWCEDVGRWRPRPIYKNALLCYACMLRFGLKPMEKGEPVKGVKWCHKRRKWEAKLSFRKRLIPLGLYSNEHEAEEALQIALKIREVTPLETPVFSFRKAIYKELSKYTKAVGLNIVNSWAAPDVKF